MAESLIKYTPKRRTLMIDKCFRQVLAELPENPVIKEFDVLFNPEYKVDVLRMMATVCRTIPFSMVWSGRLKGSKLIYAEEGYQDYKEYNVADYDVTCIK